MKNILHIITSPRGEDSISIQLGNEIVNRLQEKYPESNVTELNLGENPYPHINGTLINAMRTPPDLLTEDARYILQPSEDAVQQLFDQDILVIGIPLYNLGIPSNLKSWFDLVVRAGKTFSYSPEGYTGLVGNKKVYIAFSAGGVYSEGPAKDIDHATPYLKTVLGFMGITDVTFIHAEGFAIPGIQDTALEKAFNAIAV
jgi:FMN-dependent NADH-azoreductase